MTWSSVLSLSLWISLEIAKSDKHTSLPQFRISYNSEKVYGTSPRWTN